MRAVYRLKVNKLKFHPPLHPSHSAEGGEIEIIPKA
jgi:hypothetical protein